MSCEIKSVLSLVQRRSAPAGASQILTGRWVTLNGNGEAVYPGAGSKRGLYLVLEGTHIHKGTNLQFAGSGSYDSTNAEELPAVKASKACALAYGCFRFQVGSEGCAPGASLTVGALVDVDAAGRLIASLAATDAMGKVEAITTDANGITSLTIRTLG
ncbi:MAG TPA: hypothetical protein VLH09_05120 [Bryobacteraceae bacterium]|nr:hypothetical protein [Bryobacteraceae bacterium]